VTDLRMPELFHSGMIVDDIEKVMASMAEGFGTLWSEPVLRGGQTWSPDGAKSRSMLVTYSIGGEHQIELVQLLDDTAWAWAKGGPWLHHLGYWVDDLRGEIARLEKCGYVLQLGNGPLDQGPQHFAYLYHPQGGLYIELVDVSIKDGIDAMLARPAVRPRS
jgi:hypothetical protein